MRRREVKAGKGDEARRNNKKETKESLYRIAGCPTSFLQISRNWDKKWRGAQLSLLLLLLRGPCVHTRSAYKLIPVRRELQREGRQREKKKKRKESSWKNWPTVLLRVAGAGLTLVYPVLALSRAIIYPARHILKEGWLALQDFYTATAFIR